jgi:hypothetical protein
MTRDLLKKHFAELAEDGALEICIIKERAASDRFGVRDFQRKIQKLFAAPRSVGS